MNHLYRTLLAFSVFATLFLAQSLVFGQGNPNLSCETVRATYLEGFDNGWPSNTGSCATPGNINWPTPPNATPFENWGVARNNNRMATTPFNAYDGACTLPGFYNADVSAGNRMIGSINANGGTNTIYVRFINTSNTNITSLNVLVSYAQFYRGNNGPDRDNLNCQIGTNINILDPLNSAGWANVPALNFQSIVTGPVGPTPNTDTAPVNAIIPVNIPPGDDVWLRWVDQDLTTGNGADDGLGIAQILVSPTFRYPTTTSFLGDRTVCNSPGNQETYTANTGVFLPTPGTTTFTWSVAGPGPTFVGPSTGLDQKTATLDFTGVPPGNYDLELAIVFPGDLVEPGNCFDNTANPFRVTITVVKCGPIDLTCQENIYSQDFDAIPGMPTANSCGNPGNIVIGTIWINDQTVPGWSAQNQGISTTAFNSSNGACNGTPTALWLGTIGNNERAFGTFMVNLPERYSVGSRFRNLTGQTINQLDVFYIGEQWSKNNTGIGRDRLLFQYSLDATDMTNGTWVDVPTLHFVAPVNVGPTGPLDGNQVANQENITAVFTVPGGIPNNATFWFRWMDEDATGPDDALGIDNFILSLPEINPAAPTAINGTAVVCPGDIVTYTADPSDACLTYFWTPLPVGADYVGATDQASVTVDWGTLAPGNYTLTLQYTQNSVSNFLDLPITIQNCGPIIVDCANLTYDQNFGALTPTANDCSVPGNVPYFNNLTIPGWYAVRAGGAPFNSNNGGCNLESFYGFGADAAADRAFGSLNPENIPQIIAARYRNSTGTSITSMEISYTGEQWRRGGGSNIEDVLAFEWSIDATSADDAIATWNPDATLDFRSPNASAVGGPLPGNLPANQTAFGPITINIPGGIPNGQEFWIRWVDQSLVGFDEDGLSIDDLTVVFDAAPERPTSIAGNLSACLGTSEAYTATPNQAGVSYTWSGLPAGASFTTPNPGNPITVNWGTALDATYTLSVVASNACGTALAQTVDVVLAPCGPIELSCNSPNYAQDFNGITPRSNDCNTPGNIAWTDDQTVRGWYTANASVGGIDRWNASDGNCAQGSIYSFGVNNDADRALGSQRSGDNAPIFGVNFVNGDVSATITDLIITYTGEQWRRGTGADALNFEFSTDATNLTNGTWNGVPALNFVSPNVGPVLALDGNLGINQINFNQIVVSGQNIIPGQQFWLRWVDVAGGTDGLSIDDFNVTINTVPMPATLAVTSGIQCVNTVLNLQATPAAGPNVAYDWSDQNFNFLGTGNTLVFAPTVSGTYTITVAPFDNVTGCISNLPSPELVLDISLATVAGTLSADLTVCFGDQVNLSVSGRVGNIVDWFLSTNNFGTETPQLFTGAALVPQPTVTSRVQYEVEVKSGNCPALRTNRITLDVSNNPGTVTTAGPTNVCHGNNNGTLTLTGFAGTVVRWESTTANINFTVPGQITTLTNVTASQTYTNLTQTTFFRAIVSSPGCPSSPAPGFAINVLNAPGTIVADQNTALCNGDNVVTLTATGFTGNISGWQLSNDNFAANIVATGNPNPQLTINNITQNLCYRPIIQVATCADLFPTPICFTVQPCTPIIFTCNQLTYSQGFDGVFNDNTNSCNTPGNINFTNNLTIPGWYAQRTSGATTRFNATDGTCASGSMLSLGADGSPERAFGSLLSGSGGFTFGARFVNNTGGTITQLFLNYIGEQWSRGNITDFNPDRLAFSYSVDPATLSLTSGVWTPFPALDVESSFTARVATALDGNLPANRSPEGSSIPALGIPPGATFWIRWVDFDFSPGADDALGIDSFNIRVLATPPFTFSPIVTQIRCNGANNGSITIGVPAGNFGFNWQRNAVAFATTKDIAALTPGTYTLTITDNTSGCRQTLSQNITEPAAIVLTPGTISQPGCTTPNGSINMAVSGGTTPYTFLWSNGSSSQNLSNVGPDIYSLTVTDANGCQRVSQNFNLFLNSPIIVDAPQITHVSCSGAGDGAIGLTVTGGVQPLTYLWSNAATSSNIIGIAGGVYNVRITDNNGCFIDRSYTVNEPFTLSVIENVIGNVICNGGSNGSIGVDIIGGTAPYTIIWNNQATTENLSGLTAGTYTVNVTDARNCRVSASFTVGQPQPLAANISNLVPPTCNGSKNGSATVNISGGTPGYNITWNNNENTPTATALGAGIISVNISDSKGCVTSASATLTQPTAINVNFTSVRNIRCNGGANGSINVQVSGGTPIYTFAWSHGATTADASGLLPGGYTLTVTDTRNCTASKSAFITEPSRLTVDVAAITQIACNGNTTGTVSFAVAGGTPPYTHAWTSNSTTVTVNSPTASGLAAGSYTLTVRDAQNCIATAVAVVNQPAAALSINLNSITPVACNGGSDGQVATTVFGGTQPYSITWSNNPSRLDGLANVTAGSYTMFVTDANGCKTQSVFVVPQPAKVVITLVSSSDVSCPGGNDGAISVSASGGVPGYSFFWSPGSPGNSSRNNLTAGTYIISVRDINNCSASITKVLAQPQPIVITTASQSNPGCNASSTGIIDVSISGGTPNYSFQWNQGSTTVRSTEDLLNAPAGAYQLVVTDSRNCTSSKFYTLGQPDALSASMSNVVNPTCNGLGGGSARVNAIGGTQPYTYMWSNGGSSNQLFNAIAGNYVVTVTDAKGCQTITSVLLTEPDPITIVLTNSTNILCWGAATGSMSVAATGGTAGYTYSWSTGSTNPMITNQRAGTFSVTATDSKGCTGSRNDLVLTQPATPISIFTQFLTPVNCGGQNTGTIALVVTGGAGGFRFQWNDGATTEDRSGLAVGNYSVTATDANNCTAIQSFVIGGPTTPLSLTTDFITQVSCQGRQDGALSISANGGTRPYNYLWSTGANTSFINNLRGGGYSITVTDANGCSRVSSFVLTEPAVLIVNRIDQKNITCANTSTGSITVAGLGGTAPYNYQWTNGSTSPNVTNLKRGIYGVVISDANGCVANSTFFIQEGNVLKVSLLSADNINCFGQATGRVSVQVSGGVAPYDYIWNGPVGNATINNLRAGSYSVLVTDQAGCSLVFTHTITEPAELRVTTGAKIQARCNGAPNGALGINVAGGTQPYTFRWSNGATTEDISNLTAGSYTVTVTDAKGCQKTLSEEITQPEPLILQAALVVKPSCHNSNDGTIALVATGGTGQYRYNWSSALTIQPVRTNLVAGTYSATVTDARGCKGSLTIELVAPPALEIGLTQLRNTNCVGRDRGIIDVEPIGGTGPYEYWWSTSSNLQDLANIPAGTYVLNLRDANLCSVFRTFEVKVEPNENGIINGLPATACVNSAPVTLSSLPAPGTFSGPGVTGTTFNPAAAGPGTHTISVSGTFDGCPFIGSQTVVVNGVPVNTGAITFIGTPTGPPFCASNTNQYLLIVNPGQANTSTMFSGKGVFGSASSFYRFSPALAGAGTHNIRATLTNLQTGCSSEINRSITVDGPALVTVSADSPTLCNGQSTLLQATGGDTYTWTPTTGLSCAPNCTGVGASVTAMPTRSQTYSVTAIKGGCSITTTVRVEVKDTKPISVLASPSTICEFQTAQLIAVSATPYDYNWAPATNLSSPTGQFVTASPRTTTNYTVTGTFDGCTTTQTVRVTVNPSLVQVQAQPTSICQGQSTTLRAFSTEPGNHSYLWSPSAGLSSTTGAIVTATPTSTTTYTVRRSGPGTCLTAVITIVVTPFNAQINNLKDVYCIAEGPANLSGTPAGGLIVGPGVTGNQFNPANAGIGTHVIRYIGVSPGGCPYDVARVIEVGNFGSATVNNLKAEYCYISSPVTLVGQPAGGTFSGPGMVGNQFSPLSLAPNQTYTITYSGTPPNGGCNFSVSLPVRIHRPTVAVEGLDAAYCLGSPAQVLNGQPFGGTFIGNGIRNGNIFDPNLAGIGVHQITYFGTDGICNYSTAVSVRVTNGPTISAVASNASCVSCANGTLVINASNGTAPYQYSIDGGNSFVSSNSFNGQLPGLYLVAVRDASGCESISIVSIGIDNQPASCETPTITSVEPGQTDVRVNYSLSSGADRYVLSIREDVIGAPWITVSVNSATATSFSFANLKPGSRYQLRIRARCGTNQSPWSNLTIFNTLTNREEALSSIITASLQVYPNPNRGEFLLRLETTASTQLKWTLSDAAGRSIQQHETALEAGTHELPINIDVAAGVYLLHIESDGQHFYQKVMIQ